MPCTTDSPSPVPWPTGLVVKNGSKMRARISGVMPAPVSRTVSRGVRAGLQLGGSRRARSASTRAGSTRTSQRAALLHGVRGVGREVQEHLVELRLVGEHERRALVEGRVRISIVAGSDARSSAIASRTTRVQLARARAPLRRGG